MVDWERVERNGGFASVGGLYRFGKGTLGGKNRTITELTAQQWVECAVSVCGVMWHGIG